MAINENPYNGARLHLRDSQWSSKFFGGDVPLNKPKTKFTFLAGFIPNSNIASTEDMSDIYDQMTFLVKSFDPPQISPETEVLNQYNKKRIIQRKVNYEPVSMRLHDDTGNKVFKMLYNYIRYYYTDSYNVDDVDWNLDTVSGMINEGMWGYSLNYRKYFFKKMYVAWINAGTLTYMELRNPILSNISYDTLDYADGGTPLEISLNIEYEGIVFQNINAPINGDNLTDVEAFVKDKLLKTEEIGQFGEGPSPTSKSTEGGRPAGLGELFTAGSNFYHKYNGKPTVKDAVKDFIIRPNVSFGSINSWGNFNFGGIGNSNPSGLLDPIAKPLGSVYNTVTGGGLNPFSAGSKILKQTNGNSTTSPNSQPPQANSAYKNITGSEPDER